MLVGFAIIPSLRARFIASQILELAVFRHPRHFHRFADARHAKISSH